MVLVVVMGTRDSISRRGQVLRGSRFDVDIDSHSSRVDANGQFCFYCPD